MLGLKYRLSKNRDFRYIYRRGKNHAAQTVAMTYIKSRNTDELLIGFTASRKVAKAVERNRIKRMMREHIRHMMQDISPGHRIIFTARKSANGSSYANIGKDLEHLLVKANLFSKKHEGKSNENSISGTH
ncbi:MAG: ribonuclease P protein component [Clostridiales bacterium]|nr:ribonuclease P protein component [Clostridiales bacterium]